MPGLVSVIRFSLSLSRRGPMTVKNYATLYFSRSFSRSSASLVRVSPARSLRYAVVEKKRSRARSFLLFGATSFGGF